MQIVIFPDDIYLIFEVDRKYNILSTANDCFMANNLALNIKQTKCLEFTLTNVPKIDSIVMFDGTALKHNDFNVFLGIKTDSRLQWIAHLTNVTNNIWLYERGDS